MKKTKHDAVYEFFEKKIKEIAEADLGFNFSDEFANEFSIITNYTGNIRKKYIRAGAEKEYGFTIILVKPYSTDKDDLNREAMNFAQSISDWVEKMNKKGEYPDFPKNCQIRNLEVLQNTPNLSGINYKEKLARYMIQCRIIYFEREV